MTKAKKFSNVLAAVIMAAFLFGCSETEQFVNEPLVSNGQEAEAVVPVLTKSEAVALAVQQKGTYRISESEAIGKLNRHVASTSGNRERHVLRSGFIFV